MDAEPATEPGAGPGAPSGWYPDYDLPPGHERYWNGERWTDGRRTTQAARRRPPVLVWVAVVLALVAAVAVYGLVSRDSSDPAPAASTPGPVSTPGSPNVSPSASTTAESGEAAGRRTWRVTQVLDGRTLELDNGAQVSLVGIAAPTGITCATKALFELSDLVEGEIVTLTRRGPDRDAEGRLLRYVELDGVDVGLALIRRGLASATDERHARGQIYRRVAARTDSAC